MDPDQLITQGHALLTEGRVDDALAAFNEAIRLQPLMPGGFAGRAKIVGARGEHAEAVMAYDMALMMAVNDNTYGRMGLAGLWFGKADGLAGQGKHEQALAAYDTGLGLDPAHAGAIAGRGGALIALGREAEAMMLFDAVLKSQPEALPVWFAKGEAEYAAGDKDAAKKSFTRFAALVKTSGPGEAKALVPKAATRLKELLGPGTGKLTPPAEATTTVPAAAASPDEWQRLANDARGHYMAGKFDEAERTLRGAVAVAPEDQRAKLLHNLGQTLEYAGRLKEALDAYLAAAKADPRQVHTWAQLGIMFMKGRQPAYAVEALKRALALKADHAPAWHLQSQALAMLGRLAEARYAAEKALGLAPGDEAIKAHLARLQAQATHT